MTKNTLKVNEQKASLNLHQRILAIMAEVDYIQKDPKKGGQQYSTVPHDKVTAKLHPMFVKHGILAIPSIVEYEQEGNRTRVKMETQFVNADDPSQVIKICSLGYGVDSSDKGPGKATSYAFKYALLKLFCLETGDDPEHDQTTEYQPEEPTTQSLMKFMGIDESYVAKMEQFIETLAKEMKITKQGLIRQALEQKGNFTVAWNEWLNA